MERCDVIIFLHNDNGQIDSLLDRLDYIVFQIKFLMNQNKLMN